MKKISKTFTLAISLAGLFFFHAPEVSAGCTPNDVQAICSGSPSHNACGKAAAQVFSGEMNQLGAMARNSKNKHIHNSAKGVKSVAKVSAISNGQRCGACKAAVAQCQKENKSQAKACIQKSSGNPSCTAAGDMNRLGQNADQTSNSSSGLGSALLGGALGGAAGGLLTGLLMKNAMESKLKSAEAKLDQLNSQLSTLKDSQKKLDDLNKKLDDLQNNGGIPGSVATPGNLPVGPSGVAAQIEAAISSGDYAKVKQLLADNPQLPKSYVDDVEKRIASASTSTSTASTGTASALGPAVAMRNTASEPSIDELLTNKDYEHAKMAIQQLINKGDLLKANSYIVRMVSSSDYRQADVGRSLQGQLDKKLANMGFPAGEVGLQMISNRQ